MARVGGGGRTRDNPGEFFVEFHRPKTHSRHKEKVAYVVYPILPPIRCNGKLLLLLFKLFVYDVVIKTCFVWVFFFWVITRISNVIFYFFYSSKKCFQR